MTPYQVRIQFTYFGVLQAEVVVETPEIADKVTADYFTLRYKKGMGLGGVIRYRADLPRYFDVPVGTDLYSDKRD